MNEDLIRIVPKPSERPAYVESIFSSDLNLTPEKRRPKSNALRKPKAKALQKNPVTVVIENPENHKNIPRLVKMF